MKVVIYFIGRLMVACVLLIIFAVVLSIVALILLSTTGKYNAGIIASSFVLPVVMACAPAVFVASLTSNDMKKTRFWAALKSIVVVSVIYALWSYFVGPWIGAKLSTGANALQIVFAIYGLVVTVLMFLSGILAANWLPSLKPSAVGAPPKTVRTFEVLMFVYLGIFLISTVLNYDRAVEQVSATASSTVLTGMMGGPFVIATFATSFLITFYLTVKVSRAGSKAMRAVMLGFYLIGVISSVPNITNTLQTNQLLVMLSLVLLFIQGCAIYLVFTPESNKWFAGDNAQISKIPSAIGN
ncbi:MAG: hypothetical protein WEB02_07800 [Methylophaga sp.]